MLKELPKVRYIFKVCSNCKNKTEHSIMASRDGRHEFITCQVCGYEKKVKV
jgi:translation initiation factor 2 beta subunit (eIF-2beta)/eIF-5